MAQIHDQKDLEERVGYRIGLALSGGGYRASLFHLGVIRRLEELGIMQDVSVISCISGGSIIGTFYTTEMEQRLRSRREQIERIWLEHRHDATARQRKENENKIRLKIAKIRLEIFEEIAEKFFVAMDKNMRMRATLFAPFFHINGIRALFSKSYTRAELIQLEYDRWLFHKGVVDFLPSYHIISEKDFKERRKGQTGYQLHSGYHVYKTQDEIRAQLGPKVVVTATSLLNGENKSFYRVPIWGFTEMTKTNENIEKLSKIVGASSAVPGVFPPAVISGDVLMDGGVSDNQGLHLFLGEEQKEEYYPTSSEQYEECDILLVSDASGQMLKVDHMGRKEFPVLTRTQSIQSFELRNKNIDLLVKWKKGKDDEKGKRKNKENKKEPLFAFVHLYRSLKDREEFVGRNRVPSEYVSALGGLRTDLDQFSHIEREALMYHGYTLIDNQLREWCGDFLRDRDLDYDINSKSLNERLAAKDQIAAVQKLRKPPLFAETIIGEGKKSLDKSTQLRKYREKIEKHLEAGASLLLTPRLWKDRKILVSLFYVISVGVPLYLALRFFRIIKEQFSPWAIGYLTSLINSAVPEWLQDILAWLEDAGYVAWPITSAGMEILSTLLVIALGCYLIFGALFSYIGQPLSIYFDKRLYKKLTGKKPRNGDRIHWEDAPKLTRGLDDDLDFRVITQQSFKWPEAIDIDKDGVIYFTDLSKKALYRIDRNKGDNSLKGQEELLIFGFEHISGLSVDNETGFLYAGARTKKEGISTWAIIKFPLAIFDACAKDPKAYAELKAQLVREGIEIQELLIDGRPNGVRFVPDESGGEIFYTCEKIFSGNGYVGSTSRAREKTHMVTPNGIDLDTSVKEPTLVITLFRKNAFTRVSLDNQVIGTPHKIKRPRTLFGPGPDGLLCLENGDVLIASFWRGEILHHAFDGSSYADPVPIVKELGNPTDMVLGLSSDGHGESLYVTTTRLWRFLLSGDGKVVEIPMIREKITSAHR